MVDFATWQRPAKNGSTGTRSNPSRSRMRAAAEASGLTQEAIGVKMGFAGEHRKAVSRLLNADSYDPRLSTLAAFADAVGKPLKDLA